MDSSLKEVRMAGYKPEFMSRAIELALRGIRSNKGGPFGALIVKNGKIIAEGFNRVTSSNDPTAHAEICAIRRACSTLETFCLKGYELYTSCEPCPMCLGAIYWARISKVYFAVTRKDAANIGFDDEFIYTELAKPPKRRKLPLKQVPTPNALRPFDEWRAKVKKTPY